MSRGTRRHIRAVKAEIRADLNQFLTDEEASIQQLRNMTNNDLTIKEEAMLRKWWQIRKEFAGTKDAEKFDKLRMEFDLTLDKDRIESPRFFTALRFISESFSRAVGK